MTTKIFAVLVLALALVSCSGGEWICDSDFNGRTGTTEADTYIHPTLDHRDYDNFIGGLNEVTIQGHCTKGSRGRFSVRGRTHFTDKSFSGWVEVSDVGLD